MHDDHRIPHLPRGGVVSDLEMSNLGPDYGNFSAANPPRPCQRFVGLRLPVLGPAKLVTQNFLTLEEGARPYERRDQPPTYRSVSRPTALRIASWRGFSFVIMMRVCPREFPLRQRRGPGHGPHSAPHLHVRRQELATPALQILA